MGKLLAALFGAIVMTVVVGLDYWTFTKAQAAAAARGEATEDSYIDAKTALIDPWLNPEPEFTLTTLLPPAPDGWQRRPYEMTDGAALTQASYVQYAEATDTTTAILQRLSLERREASRMAETYVGPDGRMVVIRVEYISAERQPSPAAKLARRAFLKARDADMEAASPFFEGGGIMLSLTPAANIDHATGNRTEAAYRRVIASPSRFVDIDVVSDLTDDALLSFLTGWDLTGLAGLVTDPAAVATTTGGETDETVAETALCVRKAGKLVCD